MTDINERVHALLAWCARPTLSAELTTEFARRAAAVDDWDAALSAAEQHGLSPLLHSHLRTAQIGVTPLAARQLQALYVRHRDSNGIRRKALRDIVDALEGRGIDVRVLKGLALMSLVYPDPALRPASDIDLLVPFHRALDAQRALRDLGYAASDGASVETLRSHHHLPQATRSIDGVSVGVEVHHDALAVDWPERLRLDATREVPIAVDIGGRHALALGPHDMLWHLCEHLAGALPRPLRLIWLADVAAWATAFATTLDWERLRRHHPIVLNVLALANRLTPLPCDVASHVPAATIEAFAVVTNESEWLWASDSSRSDVGRWDQLRHSLRPPAWWTLLRYGPAGRRAAATRLEHLRMVARVSIHRGLHRLTRRRQSPAQ